MRWAVAILLAAGTVTCGCAARARTTAVPHASVEEIASARPDVVTPESAAASSDAGEPVDGIVHVVQAGQTLWRIARAYDVPLDTLAEANGIANPSRVEVGTPIFIPGARATLEVAAYPAPVPFAHPQGQMHAEPSGDFLWPVERGTFMRPFGEPRPHHLHAGVDIRGSRGQDIRAAKDGTVAFCGGTKTGYGTMVVLDHGDGVQTLYAHAQKVLVHLGEAVRRGEAIALLGRTGNATTEHCHFEIRLENRAVDPMPFLLGTTEAHR